MKLVYNIDSVSDKNGGKKSIPSDWYRDYFIFVATVGRSAILVDENDTNMTLTTSTVQEISLWENGVKITTRNTVYYLKPVVKGE